MSLKQIEYYKLRDFGEKFNVTFEFLKIHFKPLFIITMIVAIPTNIINLMVNSLLFKSLPTRMADESDFGEALANLGGQLSLSMVLGFIGLVSTSVFLGAVLIYVKQAQNQTVPPDVNEIFGKVLKKLPGLILLSIVVSIIIFFGLLFFIIPGIYLGTVFSLSFVVFIFEDEGFGNSLSKPFLIIKEKFFSTLGLLVVSTIIAGLVSSVFLVPAFILMIGDWFSITDLNNLNAENYILDYSDPKIIIGSFISSFTTLVYIIPIVAVCFQYFNLIERTEGRGFKSQIDDFEKLQ